MYRFLPKASHAPSTHTYCFAGDHAWISTPPSPIHQHATPTFHKDSNRAGNAALAVGGCTGVLPGILCSCPADFQVVLSSRLENGHMAVRLQGLAILVPHHSGWRVGCKAQTNKTRCKHIISQVGSAHINLPLYTAWANPEIQQTPTRD